MVVAQPADPAVTARLEPYLRPGEQLLWCGRPDPAVVFSAADIITVPFGLIWLGIALGWVITAKSVGAPHAFILLGLPFILIGLYLVVGRFAVRLVRRRRTLYAITGERVIVATGASFRDTPVRGGSMSVRRRRNGRHATVVFEPFGSYYVTDTSMTGPPMAGTGMPTMSTTRRRVAPGSLRFESVADPDALLAAINQAKAQQG
jgi:hypothetical protein